jgi:hypothetical protein
VSAAAADRQRKQRLELLLGFPAGDGGDLAAGIEADREQKRRK